MNRPATPSFLPLPALLALVLLGGCAAQPDVRQADTAVGEPVIGEPGTPVDSAPGEFTAAIERASALVEARQLLPAASILRDIEGGKLNDAERAQILLLNIELSYLQGDATAALAALQAELPRLGPLPVDTFWALQTWQLELLRMTRGSLVAAAHAERLLVRSEPDSPQRRQLIRFTWENLNRCEPAALQAALQTAAPAWRGWLELALLAAGVMESPDVQALELELWQERHPDHLSHPALPGNLDRLVPLASDIPRRVALMLPLSGGQESEGRAVLEGFLAAQFEARRRGWPQQEIMVLDSNAFADTNAAYQRATGDGAELVIGPLGPGQLQGWQAPDIITAPLLSLGRLPDAAVTEAPPYQLSLAAEDEASQLAELAFDRGARHALLIRPEGAWGDSMSDALLQRWTGLEGTVHAVATYSGQSDHSSSLKQALNLAQSEQRASRVRRLMGAPMEFTPRPRADLDSIFLLSNTPQDARSIKPLLAFHYVGALPVYSTSHIFSGRLDPQRDRDLNDIYLVDIPWILAQGGPLRTALAESGADDTRTALHALGADAFLLNWRIQQLEADSGSLLRGFTGLLHMDDDRRLRRELVPAQFRRGVPEAL